MMTLNCLIVDDEPLAHEVIKKYSKDVDFVTIAGQCYSATEALSYLDEDSIDLMFLDIEMPKLKGLDLLETLSDPPLVIVISAYEEYALEGYELNVCDYLLKPFRFKRFLKAVQKARDLYRLKNKDVNQKGKLSQEVKSERIPIKSDGKYIQTDLDKIYYLESYGNYVKVWLEDKYLLTPRTLKSFEEHLPEDRFLRIHKSHMVNMDYIDYLGGNQIKLYDGTPLTIGKTYRKKIKERLSPEE